MKICAFGRLLILFTALLLPQQGWSAAFSALNFGSSANVRGDYFESHGGLGTATSYGPVASQDPLASSSADQGNLYSGAAIGGSTAGSNSHGIATAAVKWNAVGGSLFGNSKANASASGGTFSDGQFYSRAEGTSGSGASLRVDAQFPFGQFAQIRGFYSAHVTSIGASGGTSEILIDGQLFNQAAGGFNILVPGPIDFRIQTTARTDAGGSATFVDLPQRVTSVASIVWGIGAFGSIPGETPDNPLLPDNQDVDDPEMVDGVFLTFPAVGDYGRDNFVFIDPDFATGYSYEVEGSNFAGFVVPNALAGGDATFEIEVLGARYTLLAGQEFDFTAIDPDGVSQFNLLGLDLQEAIDPETHAPFVSGVKFVDEGVVTVHQSPLVTNVLAGDFDANGVVNAHDYIVWRDDFGSTTALRADHNGSRAVDAADYVIWRDQVGAGGFTVAANTAVPEPAMAYLLFIVTAGVIGYRQRRKQ